MTDRKKHGHVEGRIYVQKRYNLHRGTRPASETEPLSRDDHDESVISKGKYIASR